MDSTDPEEQSTSDLDLDGPSAHPDAGIGEDHPRPPDTRLSAGKATLTGFALAVAGFVTAIVLAVPLGLVVDVRSLSRLEGVLVNLVLLQGIAFPLVTFGYLKIRGLSLEFLGIRRPSLRDILVGIGGFALAFVLVFAAGIVISQIGLQTAERTDSAALRDPQVLLTLIPLALVLIGPGEELLFRGAIQSTLRESFSAPVAIVVANLAFAPAHILALTGSIQALALSISILFIPGLVFGTVYEYTDNVIVPALSHGLYNATLFGIVYLVVTRTGGTPMLS